MIDPYSTIRLKPKLNKKKVFFAILTIFFIIVISIYSGIKTAEYENENKKKQIAIQKQEEIEQIEAQKKAEEQEKLEKEKTEQEARTAKVTNIFSEEQMQAVEDIYSAPEGEKRVFLTFDDGPTQAVTPFILDLLKQENIKATFFVLGNRVKANPELIKREFEEGHYVANHGYTHQYSAIYQNPQAVLDEYNYTNKCVQEALGNPNFHTKIFRFPGGSNGGYYNSIKQEAKALLKQNNIVHLDWNCLSKDAEGAKTKEQLVQNVIDTAGTRRSLVILMHDAADKILTYEALPDIIKYLRENGYTFMNLYDIL